MTARTLLLFDIDGVLVYPNGYKEALRATIDHFAGAMGLPSQTLTNDEIATFEACGITNEWDSAPLCVGAILIAVLAAKPVLPRSTFDDTLNVLREADISIDRPDFEHLARQVRKKTGDSIQPAPAVLEIFREQANTQSWHLLDKLLADTYSINTPTTRIFQHYVLGNDLFEQTYNVPADFEIESMLKRFDKPLLTPEMTGRLMEWVKEPSNGAAIYTARPSLPPRDLSHSNEDLIGYSPEADLAAELLDMADDIPLIAGGRLGWLAKQNGQHYGEYIKPSPVQALAAIGAAISGQEAPAMVSALAFYEMGELTEPLSRLAEGSTRIVVFEDSTGGIRATQRAGEALRQAGLPVMVEGVGIATESSKKKALSEMTSRVVESINEAVEPYLHG
ncbi:MAG: hypothetical protein JXJ17_11690 [Anaerolineae bacterium]|nr:hypothetical protein [Anaerolineae bacterium]